MRHNTFVHVPLKRRVPGTTYTVDCFNVPCSYTTHHFLSHFHADHYSGLARSFTGSIYCSETTGNLVHLLLKVPRSQINTLCLHKTYELAPGHFVTCLDANHCPGAVCFVFCIDGRNYLHTGDFRAAPCFYEQPLLDLKFDTIFLDNTFENYRSFCAQRDAVRTIIEIILKKQSQSSLVPLRFVFLFSSYLVGKEKCFLSVAEYFDKRVTVCGRKMRVYSSYSSYSVQKLNREVLDFVDYARETIDESLQNTCVVHSAPPSCTRSGAAPRGGETQSTAWKAVQKGIRTGILQYMSKERITSTLRTVAEKAGGEKDEKRETDAATKAETSACCAQNKRTPFDRITTEARDTNIFLVSACTVSKDRINSIVRNIKCDRAVVFCATGWAGKTVFYDLERQNMVTKKGIEVIHVPYSEHSSSNELEEFRSRMSYAAIINTVK